MKCTEIMVEFDASSLASELLALRITWGSSTPRGGFLYNAHEQ